MSRGVQALARGWLAIVSPLLALALAATLVLATGLTTTASAAFEGIHKIQHVVMIQQENRSFDHYFGTYPGANGIPAGVCVPDPVNGGCVKPFHDPSVVNHGGPHGTGSTINDINGGKMDGYIKVAEEGLEKKGIKCGPDSPQCGSCKTTEEAGLCVDVMGYHDAREIPNYWAYAHNFVLQDNMYESSSSWSLPEHLYAVSGWSAVCPDDDLNPMDCTNSLSPIVPSTSWSGPIIPGKATYAWTDLTYLMFRAKVSWRYYVMEGDEPDCEVDEEATCKGVLQDAKTPGIWNPLPDFTTVNQDHQRGNIQPLTHFYHDVHQQPECGLPNVAWVTPNNAVAEHPPSTVSRGQAFVTTLINTIMKSPCWDSTAIFLSWDDWGGFYDHVQPPVIDENGYGLRVPGLVISPYAKTGLIDKQQLSHDSYLKFIEDDFLKSARLNPATDGRPDKRPDVREEATGLGDLANDFEFNQAPRPPLLLSPNPEPGPPSEPPGGVPNAPTPVTGPASAIAATSATLNATVNPDEGLVSDCHFEYGTTKLFGSSVPCTPSPGGGESPVAVSAPVTSLTAGTSYYYRVVATNAGGTSYGSLRAFATAAASGSPTLGRCQRLAGEPTGKYETSDCLTTSAGENSGPYEWSPGPGANASFNGSGGATTLGANGSWHVSCASADLDGEVTGPRTVTATIAFSGCTNATLQASCQSAGAADGIIDSNPLVGELGYVEGGAHPIVGLDLKPSVLTAPIAVGYECGDSSSGLTGVVSETGSVIGRMTEQDVMSRILGLEYQANEGHQVPERFEGGTADTLTATVHPSEGESLQATASWTSTIGGFFAEALELKAAS
jgi:phospholipase C